jgi:signal transduction histidine kinase/CheY-like chemotaxis protein/purine-cytosine permease-like protein
MKRSPVCRDCDCHAAPRGGDALRMEAVGGCRAAPSARQGESAGEPLQRVIKLRRDYNSWVAKETIEDYALRFTPRAFRRWPAWRVANTAFGAASFLVLEAVGATLLAEHGFVNAFWAILTTGLVILLAGLPISAYAARYGLDMDLLTRGAGFGYIGSTITSLIYASFTFIFFAFEAAIMAYALDLAFDIPPAWGYLLCALVVLPLVTHGVTAISRLQVWTQPLWLVLLVAPYVFVFKAHPHALQGLVGYGGSANVQGFSLLHYGAAVTVGVALLTQMGEQADYLRFMPAPVPGQRKRWWLAVLAGGPGWVLPGILKMLGGALLAYLAITLMVPTERAVDPNQMYLAAWESAFPNLRWAVAATALFVVVSQLKINVTNAYAGSLAWSNFFARLTHSHPGRVVWMVFNTLIALMLMELDVFQALGRVLGLYSNIALSWLMAVVADLVINKPLGLSPKGIEFKRAHLYDINPVGVGAMGIASALSVAAYLGGFGALAQAFSALIALVAAMVASPLIAWATRGRYYLARRPEPLQATHLRCSVCERDYEADDVARCPAYQGPICSLCCSLDARCHDLCKPHATLAAQWAALLQRLLPAGARPVLSHGLGHYLLLMCGLVPATALLFWLAYQHQLQLLADQAAAFAGPLRWSYVKVYAAVLLVVGVLAWWVVLTQQSRRVAQEESNRQTQLLMQEIASHRRTDEQLQLAKRQAESASQAKTRYLTAISHELRTPLNGILGYAQLLDEDPALPEHRRHAVQVIRRGGDHLLSLIEGTLDIARIEAGRLQLQPKPLRFRELVAQIAGLFELQARGKGLAFEHQVEGAIPDTVRADEARLKQILLNVVGNAVKFTQIGHVTLRTSYAREIARFEIEDTGPGMSADELQRVFEPFARGTAQGSTAGTGLGLTIAKMLTDLMGGEMQVASVPGQGTTFSIRLFLPELRPGANGGAAVRGTPIAYDGARRQLLVVDNEEVDRALLAAWFAPLGLSITQAANGEQAVMLVQQGLRPDAVWMDLAMPGIDGWEAIRRLRAQGLRAPVAIVSANGYDRALDNDVGITPDDFFVKPVQREQLVDWLARRLSLHWQYAVPTPQATPQPATAPAPPAPLPPGAAAQALADALRIGHYRGVLQALDALEAAHPPSAASVGQARVLAREFRFDTIAQTLLHPGPVSVASPPGAQLGPAGYRSEP